MTTAVVFFVSDDGEQRNKTALRGEIAVYNRSLGTSKMIMDVCKSHKSDLYDGSHSLLASCSHPNGKEHF